MRSVRARSSRTIVACVGLTLLVVLAGVALGVVGAHDISPDASASGLDGHEPGIERATADHAGVERVGIERTDTDITVTNALFLTGDRGTIGVTTTVRTPDRLSELRMTLRSASDAPIEMDGFTRVENDDDGNPVVEWDGDTDRPSVTYRMDANVTADPEGPLATTGTYHFADVGDWAIVKTPVLDVSWRGPPGTGVVRENTVDGPGVASQAMAFLGSHEAYVYHGHSQRYRLVVPDASDLEESPERVFEAFEHASSALQVGARDEEVIAIAAPAGPVDWSPRGLQIGDADLWVVADEPAGTADDVWTHEYVHTRQAYEADESVYWFTEASAMHYAALFALERGEADFDEFRSVPARGEREPDASAVLANPATWEGRADYTKGALVAGEIDRQLRTATDGEASLATVFRELNEASEPVTIETFLDAVASAAADGGDDEGAAAIRADAERYTTTEAVPELWTRDEHEAAFGETPARIGYGIADDGVRATGEYRDRPVDSDPIRLVAGETLALDLAVRNAGGVAGDYDVTLSVDGAPVETRGGTVEPDSDLIERFEHAFADPGEYELRIGDETLSVVVSDPANVVVRDVTVATDAVGEDGTVAVGETVTVTAAFGNDGAIPAGGDAEFRVNGEPVGSESVRLDIGGETTVERELSLDDPGSTTIAVVTADSEASTTVDVKEDGFLDRSSGDDWIDETVDDVPGFGPAAVVVAILSISLLARRR
ncbi:hypothetical protein JCM18237_18580 [Halorubrum luteum]